jgi:hypothetical protein
VVCGSWLCWSAVGRTSPSAITRIVVAGFGG